MLAYFPKPYPDELLYSVFARYHIHCGCLSPKQTLEELFGKRNVRAGLALQAELPALIERLPRGVAISAESLINEDTLLPYFTAYVSPELKLWAFQKVLAGCAEAIHIRLGLVAGLVRPPTALRYCPTCREVMLETYGELYWRREHQLPGVLVCHEHGVPLLYSHVLPYGVGRHEFVAASEINCPSRATLPSWYKNNAIVSILKDIARESALLLSHPPKSRTPAQWGTFYRTELQACGLFRGDAHVDHKKLLNLYNNQYSAIFEVLPEARPESWLASFACRHRKAIAPLRHILVQHFIDQLPRYLAKRPFGDGPWLCRNPLAKHKGQAVITNCKVHFEQGKQIAVFTCSCGYVFSMSESNDQRIKILSLGHQFDELLIEYIKSGKGLRETARLLSVDTNTVRLHTTKLGMEANWKPMPQRMTQPKQQRAAVRARWQAAHSSNPNLTRTQLRRQLPGEYAWLYRNDRVWLDSCEPRPAKSVISRRRCDWTALDFETVNGLYETAFHIGAVCPPARITQASLERSLGRPGWIQKRRSKLPKSADAVKKLAETLDSFHLRRVAWAAEELRKLGMPVVAWRVRKFAKLPDRCSPVVESALNALDGAADENS